MATNKPDLTRVWANGAPPANVVDPDTTTPGKVNAGWQAEVPPFEHFNFLQKWFTQGLAHFNEQGIGVWDTDTTYPVGGLAKGSDGNLYKAMTEQSGNDPVSDGGVNWIPYKEKILNFNTSLDMVSSSNIKLNDLILTSGRLTMLDGGNSSYIAVPAGTYTPNNITVLDLPSSNLQAVLQHDGVVNVSQFGVDRSSGDVAVAINAINLLGLDCEVSGSYNQFTKIIIDTSKGGLKGVNKAIITTDSGTTVDTEMLEVFSSADYTNRPKVNTTSKIKGVAFDLASLGSVRIGGASYPESSEISFEDGAFVAPYRVKFDTNAWRSYMKRWPIVRVVSKIIEFNASSNAGEVMEFEHGWYVDSGADWVFNEGQWVFKGCSFPAGAPDSLESAMQLSGNATVSFLQGNMEYQPGEYFVGAVVSNSSRLSLKDSSITISPSDPFDRPVVMVNDDGVLNLDACSLPLYGDYLFETNGPVREVVGGGSGKIQARGCYPRAGFLAANWDKGAIVSHKINSVSNPSGQTIDTSSWINTPYGAASGSVVLSVSTDVPNTLVYDRSFRIQAPLNAGSAFTQVIPVDDPGRYFQFGFWIKSISGVTNVDLKFRRADGGVISTYSYIVDSADSVIWRWLALIEVIPAETRDVLVEFNAQEAHDTDVYIHHVIFGKI